MEKPEILFNFWLGRKTKNMGIVLFLTRNRKGREKAKISILIVLKVSLEIALSKH